jgi:drug/metabolite transporter (DMT)-like permease
VGYLYAVFAALTNAGSNVAERKANAEQDADLALRPELILRLIHRPLWLLGASGVLVSFVFQALAVGHGQLAAVEPLFVLELPFTMITARVLLGSRIAARDWAAIFALTLGLAGLVGFLSPGPGNPAGPSGSVWLLGSIANVGLIVVLFLAAKKMSGPRRAALLGAAGGSSVGLTASYMKMMTLHARGSLGVALGSILATWQTYAMVVAGLVGIYLAQQAYYSGRLIASQPGLTLFDPLVSILWGVLAFGEPTSRGWALVGASASAVLLGSAVLLLARSAALADTVPLPEGDATGTDMSACPSQA